MTFRLAKKKDSSQILTLLSQLGHVINAKVKYAPENELVHIRGKKFINQFFGSEYIQFMVAEDEGEIVAVASLYILPDFVSCNYFVHIDDFVVDDKHRNAGIGTKLLQAIKSYCLEKKIDTIKISSSLPLVESHHFYEKNGGKFKQKVITIDVQPREI